MLSGALYELSYDAAVRALNLQERAVEELRARTGALLAASSLTASFLGTQAIQHAGGLGVLGALALLSLVCSIGLSVYVLLPKRGFRFTLSGAKMYEQLRLCGEDDEVRHRLIYWLEEFWNDNQHEIDGLDRCYTAAAVALVLQLLLWAWMLVDTIS